MVKNFFNFAFLLVGCVSQEPGEIESKRPEGNSKACNANTPGVEIDSFIANKIEERIGRQSTLCADSGGAWNPLLISCQCGTGKGFKANTGCLPGVQLLSQDSIGKQAEMSRKLNWRNLVTLKSGIHIYNKSGNETDDCEGSQENKNCSDRIDNLILSQLTFPDDTKFIDSPTFVIGCAAWLKKNDAIVSLLPLIAGNPFAVDSTYMGGHDLGCTENQPPKMPDILKEEELRHSPSDSSNLKIGAIMNQAQLFLKQKYQKSLRIEWHLGGATTPDEIVQTATAILDGVEVVSIVALQNEVPFLRAITIENADNVGGMWVRAIDALGNTVYTSFTHTRSLAAYHKNSSERVTHFFDQNMDIISTIKYKENGSKKQFIADVSELERSQSRRLKTSRPNPDINVLLIDQGIDLSAPVIRKHFNPSPAVLRQFIHSHPIDGVWERKPTKPTEDVLSWQSDTSPHSANHGTDVAGVALKDLDSSYRLYYTNSNHLPAESPADIFRDPLYLDIIQNDIKVVNISLNWTYGYPDCVDYFSRLANALRHQTIFIAGAGNSGTFHPQGFCLARAARAAKNIIVVAGSNAMMKIHSGSTFGPAAAHLVAPFSVDVLRPNIDATEHSWTSLTTQGGTSFSAPAIANLVLQRLRIEPKYPPVKLAKELQLGCRHEGLPVYCGGHVNISDFINHAP